MTRFLTAFFILLGGIVSATAQQPSLLQPDEAFKLTAVRAPDGGVTFEWAIADGYYLYRDHIEAKDAVGKSALDLETGEGTKEDDPNFGVSEVYYRSTSAHLPKGTPAEILLTYQGCKKDSICYPPETRSVKIATMEIKPFAAGFGAAAPETAASEDANASGFRLSQDAASGGMVASLLADGGSLWVVASFLVFGLLLALTPCVLPMFPILGATLASSGETLTPRRGFVLSLAYVLAMATAFGLLGIAAAWSGQNLQIALQSPYAVGAVAVIFFILALSMFSLFEIQLPSSWVNRIAGGQGGRRGTVAGAAAIGFTSALIVGPCVTAPLAAALLYIAQTGDAWLGAAALFALGFGQGIPLIAFGALGSRALPKTGGWMEYVKYVFGFVLLGMAVWMAARLLLPPATLALWAALAMTASVFVGAFDTLGSDATTGRRLRKGAGMALALYALILGIGAASGGGDPLRPLTQLTLFQAPAAGSPALDFAGVSSSAELHGAIAAASAEGRPALVYFTADWCVTCAAIERDVLPAPQVADSLSGFRRFKVNLSRLDDANRSLMQELAVVGPPTMIFFAPNATEVEHTRLVGEVSIDSIVASAAQANR